MIQGLVFVLLVLLPSQLGKHFWPDWSLINGIRVDYLSPTLYLTDVLILLLMVGKGPRVKVGGLMIILAVLNIFFSLSPLVSLYKWVRVYEYFWLYKFLVRKVSGEKIRTGLSLAMIWTVVLAVWQLLLQQSVGGGWYWLGERSFSLATPGIAKVFLKLGVWEGGLRLRPYATLPHPNVLAGWLLVTGLLVGGWKQIVSLLGVLISFSRSTILLSSLILWKKSKFLVAVLLVVGYGLLANIGSPTSLTERLILNQAALAVIADHPLLGVGLGNFVHLVPTIRQPVHNIYLLLAAEIGLPATVYFIVYLFKHFLELKKFELKIAVVSVLATGLVDHYWLTLHQASLLLVVLLAAAKIEDNAVKNFL